MKNTLFYKYIDLDNIEAMQKHFLELLRELNLKGTILLAKEGINGNLTGEEKNIEQFKTMIQTDKRFSDLQFKEGVTDNHNFKKLKVKIKKEIVHSKLQVDMSNKGTYLEPKELKQWFDSNRDFVMIDMRNNYESEIGKFEKTIALDIDVFRDLPKAMPQIEHLKDKKVVAYCTGGVRCEKASAFLKEQGFSDVYQLHGGILQYGHEVGNDHWKGKCLVFDMRGAVDIDPKKQSEPITQCVLCHLPNADLHNCSLTTCDKRFTACSTCLDTLHGCCSKNCRGKLSNNQK